MLQLSYTKTSELLGLKLRPRQKIIFSDVGNLHDVPNVNSQRQWGNSDKPWGLWYSFGKAWIEFLDINSDIWWYQLKLEHVTHVYRIYLNHDDILKIHTPREFREFEERYAIASKLKIKWPEVAKKYCGIEIRYNKRLVKVGHWYYDWDCSSGCIWNRSAIKSITLLKEWIPLWSKAK